MSVFLIFMLQITNTYTYQFYNFSMNPENYQPSGSIVSNHIFFRKTYKAYTIHRFEKIDNNNDFGKSFKFLPKNDFEKNNVINCLQKYPNESRWCIYYNCIKIKITMYQKSLIFHPIYLCIIVFILSIISLTIPS